MKIVFYSVVLNNHQANVADELWELTGHQYRFVELANLSGNNRKGDTRNYDNCPYLIRAWQSEAAYQEAMDLACTAECCVFSGLLALPFQKIRLKRGLLSFDMSERWLKRGIKNIFSPTIMRMFFAYHVGGWSKKPLYKLCCSAFASEDQIRLKTYLGKCYKWGYFTKVENNHVKAFSDDIQMTITPIMWCARFLDWKHPELPILLAERLKKEGHRFVLDMYGSGEYEPQARQLVKKLGVEDVVKFCGNKPNNELMADMRKHEIFLFTSDRNEGWGAVANESMANGCVLVAGDGIGSTPYFVKDGVNGFRFTAPQTSSGFDNPDKIALNSLCEHVEWLLEHPNERKRMREQAVKQMQELWNPRIAAERLLLLMDSLMKNEKTPFIDGPCSLA